MSNILFAKEWAPQGLKTTIEEQKYLDEILTLENPIIHTKRIYYTKIEGRTTLPSNRLYTPLFEEDAQFTPNLFKNDSEASNELRSLFLVRSIAIDVDFNKNPSYKDKGAYNVWSYLRDELNVIGTKIPPPSYIEYGHNFRLIYILEEDVAVGTKGNLKTLQALIKRICDIVNEEGDFHAEPQKLNSFYRYPGSINTKDGSTVRVEQVSKERFTFQEMFEYLPDLPEWYEKWKSNKKTVVSKKGKVAKIHNRYSLCKERIAWFESLAKNGYDENRYNLCYLYAQHLAQIDEYDIEKVLSFNGLLHAPLPEKELRSKLHYVKKYKNWRYKNETISQMLGVEMMTKREIEKQEKILAGTTRKQIAEANYQKAIALRKSGLNQEQIAKEMGLSTKQISRYYKRMREEGVANE